MLLYNPPQFPLVRLAKMLCQWERSEERAKVQNDGVLSMKCLTLS